MLTCIIMVCIGVSPLKTAGTGEEPIRDAADRIDIASRIDRFVAEAPAPVT
jgi:hypothetical protein